ncbi:hypothetical protein Hanom_Chr00s000004g01606211 [Helianthus anomalus]
MMLWWFHTTASLPLLCQLIRFNPILFFSWLQGLCLHQFLTYCHLFQGICFIIDLLHMVKYFLYCVRLKVQA